MLFLFFAMHAAVSNEDRSRLEEQKEGATRLLRAVVKRRMLQTPAFSQRNTSHAQQQQQQRQRALSPPTSPPSTAAKFLLSIEASTEAVGQVQSQNTMPSTTCSSTACRLMLHVVVAAACCCCCCCMLLLLLLLLLVDVAVVGVAFWAQMLLQQHCLGHFYCCCRYC